MSSRCATFVAHWNEVEACVRGWAGRVQDNGFVLHSAALLLRLVVARGDLDGDNQTRYTDNIWTKYIQRTGSLMEVIVTRSYCLIMEGVFDCLYPAAPFLESPRLAPAPSPNWGKRHFTLET